MDCSLRTQLNSDMCVARAFVCEPHRTVSSGIMAQQVPALRPRKIEPDASIKIQWLQDDGERASSHNHASKRNPIAPKEVTV